MANMLRQLNVFCLLITVCCVCGYPDTRNPNLEYELINGGAQVGPHPVIGPVTPKAVVINTPPPVDPNSKTFAYDPISKSWTQMKKTDPPPAEDALLWNQSNDKWLTQTARI